MRLNTIVCCCIPDTRPYQSRDAILEAIKHKRDAVKRWKTVDLLVIDEVSMLDGQLFDDLEWIARRIRGNTAFFGGIQLVLCGDFFQLPPVVRRTVGGVRQRATLCFESEAWSRGIKDIVVLKEVFRQTNPEFIQMLNAFRVGRPTTGMLQTLNQRFRASIDENEEDDARAAIHIFTHNDDVLQTNTKRLDALPGKKYNYLAADTGSVDFLSACPAAATLSLKHNARVMLTKTINAAAGLVNGSRGVVQGFTPQTNLPIVRFSNGTTEIIHHEEFSVRAAGQ
ncbi:TPA: hypothetical protein N0F65_000107 [Lagenidium giganteum]|uniref:ATP-dependent DNA helicase n=1 Tax=Lagenidium giganteum TaxID=4803 RepID=A0AAV2YYX9_9STRA|nr:TPA: hypothetical protein N0F65_000107 [Lagenidium giganteum]